MEDTICGDRELVVAILAIKNPGGVDQPYNWPAAAWAFRPVRPTKPFQKFPAEIVIGESRAKFDNGHRRLLRG